MSDVLRSIIFGGLGGAIGGLVVAPFGVRAGYKLMDWLDNRREKESSP